MQEVPDMADRMVLSEIFVITCCFVFWMIPVSCVILWSSILAHVWYCYCDVKVHALGKMTSD